MWAFPPKAPAVDLTEKKNPNPPETCYIFLDKKSYPEADRDNPQTASDRELIRGNILRPFNVPDFLNNETCTDLNGYFGCKGTYSKDEKLESYSTWFRCLVKMVLKVDEDAKNYKWYEMGFFTYWDHSSRCKVLCIDTPKDLPSRLMEVLEKSPPDRRDPFAMHAPLIDQIVRLYDDSVWAIRDPIRKIEKVSPSLTPQGRNNS
ncbi:MAG: hypothetical protein M1839_003700 [Geoglossum umbratile]|nr:MAG: hypothetical protein M1839_003700 [Geoglossum umbratile]